jgi:hypothetical protein
MIACFMIISCCYRSHQLLTRFSRPSEKANSIAQIDGSITHHRCKPPKGLTNRWSQLRKHSRAGSLAVVKSTSDFMKQLLMFATLAPVSGGSAPSR